MNLTEVKKSLEQQFSQPPTVTGGRNIIFWYDDEGRFADDVENYLPDNVKFIKLYKNNMFAVKQHIEETDTESNLLVYSPFSQPSVRDNWLTDTIKYSQMFSTDETTLNIINFKFDNALRSTVAKYNVFFRNADHSSKFECYKLKLDDANKEGIDVLAARLHLGVLSALCKLSTPNLDNVVRVLLTEMANDGSKIYESIENLGNLEALWDLIKNVYGYKFEEKSLEKLAVLLLCSHLSHGINGSMPKEWQDNYVSDFPDCYVFVDNFMKNSQLQKEYDSIARFVAKRLALSDRISKWTIDEIADSDTFDEFDRSIINRITQNIVQKVEEYGHYRKIINGRKNRSHYQQFENEYDVLSYACEYFELETQHKELQGASVAEVFDGYVKNYYKIDSGYRHFITTYDKLTDKNVFSDLFDMIENSYTNWYLNELSMKWCNLWDDENAWQIPGITSQQNFYDEHVRRYVKDNERIIVIISDGLRYESAVELNNIINRERRGKSELDTMFGVVPSYTALGMASLLPHKQIEITDKAAFEIDGISTEGTENREKILRLVKAEAVAMRYEDIILLKTQQLKEKMSGMKLIYIYHNTIDARGDNAPTENEVFDATNKAFRELSDLVKNLCNKVSAINIIITADHGYIYRRTPLKERNKTPKENTVGIKSKRRFIMAQESIEKQGTQNFSMDYLTNQSNGMFVTVPRVTNCFKVQGAGSRYVHGGTSLQEIVIPVIRFISDKNYAKHHDSTRAASVSVKLTNLSRKITTKIPYLTFFQNEPVDDKHLPLQLTAYFVDEADNRISNENIIIAESNSNTPEERTYKEKFTLKNINYDKNATYYLVLKNEEETVNKELERIPFSIDIVFGGGIQF